MKYGKDEKWLDDIISEAADLGEVNFDAQKWKKEYVRNESRESPSSYAKSKVHKNFWRTIMESKVTKYSAAAVIFLTITLVLFGPFWTPGNGGVVLADVQQKVAGIDSMIIRGTKTFTRPGEPDRIFEFDGIKCKFDLVRYQSTQYGLVEEGYAEGQLFYRITFNIPEEQTLILFPKYKKYFKFTSMDAFAKVMENFATPNGILKLLIAGDSKKLGRSKIDGIEIEAFEFEDTESLEPIKDLFPKAVFNIQGFKGRVWIGIKEQLPVRIEGDLRIGKSFMTAFHDLNLREVNTLGEYNVELDEEIFSTDPPEGYTELTLTDILPLIPTEAKAGLVGLGIAPAGFVVWKRRRRKRLTSGQN